MSLRGPFLCVERAEAVAPALQGGATTLLVPAHLAEIVGETVALQAAAAPAVFVTDAEPAFSAWANVRGVVCGGATPQAVERLSGRLAVAEAEHGLDEDRLRILGMIDDAASVMRLAAFQSREDRLDGLVLDRTAVARALDVSAASDTLRVAAGLVVLAAKALGIPAIEGATPGLRDGAFRDAAAAARGDGFADKLATSLTELRIAEEVFRDLG